jgi:hypothetical protein
VKEVEGKEGRFNSFYEERWKETSGCNVQKGLIARRTKSSFLASPKDI